MQRLAVIGGLVLLAIAIVAAVRIREGLRGEDGSGADGEAVIRMASKGSRASGDDPRKSSSREGSSVRRGPVYAGPRSLAEWTPRREAATDRAMERERWAFREGTLYSSEGGAIAREIPLPATCRIAFRVRWEEQFRFRLLLFCGESEIQPDNCYDLVIQRQFAYLRKRWMTRESGGSRIIGQANVHSLNDAQEALIELLISRDDGSIVLFVNGKREAEWVDGEQEKGQFGDWIQFAAEEGFPLEIAEITADGWDGVYPDTGDPQSSFFEPDSARIAALTPQGSGFRERSRSAARTSSCRSCAATSWLEGLVRNCDARCGPETGGGRGRRQPGRSA